MAKNYLVTKMAAYGIWEGDKGPREQENTLELILASSRSFNGGCLEIQPVYVKDDNRKPNFSCSYETIGEHTACSCFDIYYQIKVHDDNVSQSNLLDAIYASMSLLEHYDEGFLLIPLEEKQIPSDRILKKKEAIEIYSKTFQYYSQSFHDDHIFNMQRGRGFKFDQTLWEIVSRIMTNEQIIYASLFLKTSYAEFQFFGDELTRVMVEHEEVPQYINEAVKLENAIHNCYKVVEAIYGGTLSTSQKKVKKKFEDLGIDTNIMVGYERFGFKQQKIIEKIYDLQHARNDRAAHGRIHEDRKSTFYELMDYQALAHFLLYIHVKNEYPCLEGIL